MSEHMPKYVEEAGLLDSFECSCGWKSKHYYDGAEFAHNEWKRHVASSTPSPTDGGNAT